MLQIENCNKFLQKIGHHTFNMIDLWTSIQDLPSLIKYVDVMNFIAVELNIWNFPFPTSLQIWPSLTGWIIVLLNFPINWKLRRLIRPQSFAEAWAAIFSFVRMKKKIYNHLSFFKSFFLHSTLQCINFSGWKKP